MKHLNIHLAVILLIIFTSGAAFNEIPPEKEEKFFEHIYNRYGNTFFELGSNQFFYESFDYKTHKPVWKLAFMVVDSSASGPKKYLRALNDTIISQYLSSTQFFYGRHSYHWEISADGKDFIGFYHNGNADFVIDPLSMTVRSEFVSIFKGITIQGQKQKEEFASHLIPLLSPAIVNNALKCKLSASEVKWEKNTLIVKHSYRDNKAIRVACAILVFDGDTLIDLSLSDRL